MLYFYYLVSVSWLTLCAFPSFIFFLEALLFNCLMLSDITYSLNNSSVRFIFPPYPRINHVNPENQVINMYFYLLKGLGNFLKQLDAVVFSKRLSSEGNGALVWNYFQLRINTVTRGDLQQQGSVCVGD